MHLSHLIELTIKLPQTLSQFSLFRNRVLVRKLFSPSLLTPSFLFYFTFCPLHHLILSSLCLGLMQRDPPLSFRLKTKIGYNSCYPHGCFGDLTLTGRKTTCQQHISFQVYATETNRLK